MVSFPSSTLLHLGNHQAEPGLACGGHNLGCAHLRRRSCSRDAEGLPALQQRPGCKDWVWPAGSPLELVQPDTLRWKVMEPVLLLGKHRFEAVDIRIRVKGGGNVSQIYGAPQYIHHHPQTMASSLLHVYLFPGWPLFVRKAQPRRPSVAVGDPFSVLCSYPASNCKGHCGVLPEM